MKIMMIQRSFKNGGVLMMRMFIMQWVQSIKHFIRKEISYLIVMAEERIDFYCLITGSVLDKINIIV